MANFKALTVPRVMGHVNPQDPDSVRDVINQLVKFSQSVGTILNGLVYTESVKRTDQDQFKVGGPGGPIAVADGGTGDATLTAHAVLIGEGTDPVGFAGPGDVGTVLVGLGATFDPIFSSSVNFGVSGSATGQVRLNSAAGGVIIVRYQTGGANWNFNMPVAAGSSGQSLLSGGGGTAAMTWGSPALVVGTSTITSGTSGRVLYDNAGVLGEMTTTGSGTVLALQTSPTLITPVLGAATITSLDFGTTVGAQEILTFHSGTTRYGIGIAGGIQKYFTGGTGTSHLWGYISTSDGTTFNQRASLDDSGNLIVSGSFTIGVGSPITLYAITATSIDFGTTAGAQEILLYHAGTTRYGFGIAASELQIFSGGTGTHTSIGTISTADGSTFTENARFNSDGTVQLDQYTTNGFVKFTSSNGTLAVDTTSYLKGGVLRSVFADVGNSTTTETDLDSYTVPASGTFGNLAANGDFLEAEYGGVFVSSATATRQVKIYFGGTAVFDTGALTLSLSAAWTAYVTITRVSSSVVRYMISLTTEGAALAAYTAVGELTGLTLSNTNILKVTGQAAAVGAATNDIVFKIGNVAKFTP